MPGAKVKVTTKKSEFSTDIWVTIVKTDGRLLKFRLTGDEAEALVKLLQNSANLRSGYLSQMANVN